MNKISIITATYNADSCLLSLIKSIIIQDIPHEFIIIDGGSTDNTIAIIRENSAYINYWISESDSGIYDAWNKGIVKATGDWIMFLGADDYLKPDALKKYTAFLNVYDKGDELLFLSSRREMMDLQGNLIRTTGYSWEWPLFKKSMTVSHPGALHSRKLFDRYGLYDIDYKISGDYELLLRPRENLNAAFMEDVTVVMSEGGTSDSINAITEYFKATTRTGGNSKVSAIMNAIVTVLKFIVKKSLRKIGLNVYLKR